MQTVVPAETRTRQASWREIPSAIDSEAAFLELFGTSPAAFWLDSSLSEPGRSRWSYLGDAAGPNAALIQCRLATGRVEIASLQESEASILPAIERDARSTEEISSRAGRPKDRLGRSAAFSQLRHDEACGHPLTQPSPTRGEGLKSARFLALSPGGRGLGEGAAPLIIGSEIQHRSTREDDRVAEPADILDYLAGATAGAPANPPPCPFVGGHVGWLGYELGEDGGVPTRQQAAMPDAFFIRADRFVAVDHLAGRSFVVAIDEPEQQARAQSWVDEIVARLADLRPAPPPTPPPQTDLVTFTLARDRAGYLADIETALDWIRAGETYQLCLTNEISCEADIDPLLLYRLLRRRNPAPFAAFLRWPGGAVLSASPERFLSVDPQGNVETKPIKGTIARAADPAEDRHRAEALLASDKDRAENIMIVDLLRNDLSRVCVPGSVTVPALCALESYATVHQLVSTVQGQLAPGKTVVDLIRACFPGGSMTGAPKHRTLALIDRLERRARGIYSGAIGWFGADGASDLSIAIRLIVAAEGRLSIGAGGGIVAQSVPEAEFEEMLLKARASIEAIALAVTGGCGPERYRLVGVDAVPSG